VDLFTVCLRVNEQTTSGAARKTGRRKAALASSINYNGRSGPQPNGGIAAVDLLTGVVKASANTPVLFDSGMRSGTDVMKGLALGATAVGIGRPCAYGLARDGVEGIVHVLRCILAEADLLMAVDGYPHIADFEPSSLLALR
jgi:lactate 2-monooxygenase